ncbi:MAG: hypothetical protein HYV26_12625 [Candidatus Hydrogenedentes bacterium]|nr:hypothetical protein [Candidatus Hydrogenedentota bacterium]
MGHALLFLEGAGPAAAQVLGAEKSHETEAARNATALALEGEFVFGLDFERALVVEERLII